MSILDDFNALVDLYSSKALEARRSPYVSSDSLIQQSLIIKTRLKRTLFDELFRLGRIPNERFDLDCEICDCIFRSQFDPSFLSIGLHDCHEKAKKLQNYKNAFLPAFHFLSLLQNTDLFPVDPQYSHELKTLFNYVNPSAVGQDLDLSSFFNPASDHSGSSTSIRGENGFEVARLSQSSFFFTPGMAEPRGIALRPDSSAVGFTSSIRGSNDSEDEGFADDLAPISARRHLDHNQPENDVWARAMDLPECRYRTWDQFGLYSPDSEPGFVTDSRSLSWTGIVEPYLSSDCILLTEETLISHCLNVLVGVSSSTFIFSMSDIEYQVRRRIRVSSLSTDALCSLLEDFAESGTAFSRLLSFYQLSSGLIRGRLAGEVKKYLQYTESGVLQLLDNADDLSLVLLHRVTQPIRAKMLFLLRLVTPVTTSGSSLLSYLYRKAMDCIGSPYYSMTLLIFRACCQPYVDLVEDWIYRCNCSSNYASEFVVQPDLQFIAHRNREFWTKAFKLDVTDDKSNVPMFLRDYVEDMFACGKSLFLLKVCQPAAYVVSNGLRQPVLRVSFSLDAIQRTEESSRSYSAKIRAVIQSQIEEKEREKERLQKMREEMKRDARHLALRELTQFSERLAEAQKESNEKKARELLELKREMEEDQKRRAAEREADKEADKELMRLGDARNAEEMARLAAIEEQAKEELIAYYEELGAEAALREQKALWRVKRRQLDEKRRDEITKLEEYMESAMDAGSAVEDSAHSGTNPEKPDDDNPMHTEAALSAADEEAAASSEPEEEGDSTVDGSNTPPPDPVEPEERSEDTVIESAVDGEPSVETVETTVDHIDVPPEISKSPEYQWQTAETPASDLYQIQVSSASQEGMQDKALEPASPDPLTKESASETIDRNEIVRHVTATSSEDKFSSIRTGYANSQNFQSTATSEDNRTVIRIDDGNQKNAESSPHEERSAIRTGYQQRDQLSLTHDGQVTKPDLMSTVRTGISMNKDSGDMLTWDEPVTSSVVATGNSQLVSQVIEEQPVFEPFLDHQEFHYQKEYPELEQSPMADIFDKYRIQDPEETAAAAAELAQCEMDVGVGNVPLPVMLKRIIVAPIINQASLVNECVRRMLMEDVNLPLHFEALRRTLLLADPEFSHTLCSGVFTLLDESSCSLFCDTYLRRALNAAVERSLWVDRDVLVDRLTLRLRGNADFIDTFKADSLAVLAINYRVDWPLNIIITESSMQKYCKIFHFLFSMKRLSWAMKSLFFHLKKTERVYECGRSRQFARVQYCRHVMQQYSDVLQQYVGSQLLHLSWFQFQAALDGASSVDQLHAVHAQYLNSMICRALLNTKAAKVMKVIIAIFSQILSFQRQVEGGYWEVSGTSGQLEHSNFLQLVDTFHSFSEYSLFLFKVVSSLAANGYQPHLQDFLLKLDFNGFYSRVSNAAK